jgi:hypothetical protein
VTAVLEFSSTAAICDRDTLSVQASGDGGVTWTTVDNPTNRSSWGSSAYNLASFIGKSAVRIGFRFSNVCGDPCGVSWSIDEVRVRMERRP